MTTVFSRSVFFRSLCLSFAGLCTIGALNSCGEKVEEQATNRVDSNASFELKRPKPAVFMQPTPVPNGELFKIEYTQHGIDSMLSMPQANEIRTPLAAAKFNLTIPPKMTVPPHVLPAKDIKVVDQNDSVATVTFAGEHNPSTGEMHLKHISNGKDSIWIVDRVITQHHPE